MLTLRDVYKKITLTIYMEDLGYNLANQTRLLVVTLSYYKMALTANYRNKRVLDRRQRLN